MVKEGPRRSETTAARAHGVIVRARLDGQGIGAQCAVD
jgi:hypothetical protein